MKKIIVFLLVVALCVPALFSCALVDKVTVLIGGPLSAVSKMYEASLPTKVVATTKQTVGALELNCSYELITGYVDNKPASVYISTTEEIRSVEDGGNNDEIKDIIKSSTRKTEAIEGVGSRVNGGDWNPDGTVWSISRGGMAINLDKKLVENVVYANNTLTFTIPSANVGAVLGEDYASDIAGDVDVTIVDDGAVIASIELHYFLVANEDANLVESEMNVKVVYTYDIERINIE